MIRQLLTSLVCAAATAVSVCGQQNTTSWSLASPDGSNIIRFDLNGRLRYSVTARGLTVVEPSLLGLQFEQLPALGPGAWRFLSREDRQADSTWQNPTGKNNPVRDRYRELTLHFAVSEIHLDVVARAYDDGVAFRYRLPDGTGKPLTLTEEQTEFQFPVDPTVWAATYEKFNHPYEHEYTRTRLAALYSSQLIGLPLLIQTQKNSFAAIAEADLTNWPGMYLRLAKRSGKGTALAAQLSPRVDGRGLAQITPSNTPIQSPWRVLMLAPTAGPLAESNLIVNLNPPPAMPDFSWVVPGKMMWDHWWSGDIRMDNETEKRFIQFAAEMNFPYQLVDWQWYGPFNKPTADITKPAAQLDWPGLLDFAKKRNVRLWIWLHSADVNRALMAGTLEKAFALYQRWGIAGVKIDFMERDDQEMVEWYSKVVALAANHRLMVNFHGAYKPTGLRRTWPNLITREAVLGNEYNKFTGRVTPEHKVTLPFTRMLVGPMDYTPGGFLNRSPDEWRQTTPTEVMGSRAGELATFVVYESPLVCLADDPDHYRGQPGLKFLRDVPTVWDETRVLDGEVGKHIVVARRHGKDWFVGGMSGEDAYSTSLPLSFLGAGTYHVDLYSDPKSASAPYQTLVESSATLTAKDKMQIAMRPAGGIAMRFTPK